MLRHDQLNAIAARQHSLVTAAQVISCGCSEAALYRMAKAAKLERVRHGVYRLCGAPVTWRSTALAAVLTAGEGAVLSYRSAAALWGLIDHHGLTGIEITHARPCRQAGITTHRHRLDRRDRTVHDHIPVTSPERTLIDLSSTHTPAELGELVDEALRRRLTSIPKLQRALDRVPATRSTGHVRAAVAEALAARGGRYDPGANSWERDMDRWWDCSGLPPARRQYRVQVGGRRYKLDRAIPQLKVAIEWNGRESHGTRSRFEYDCDRRSRLQAAGWRVLDFHYRSDPAFIVQTVQAVCEEQRRNLEPRAPSYGPEAAVAP